MPKMKHRQATEAGPEDDQQHLPEQGYSDQIALDGGHLDDG